MATSATSSAAAPALWLAVVAWTLLATTVLLLSFGALVTTYDAAMAVPDWPGTFGHNMLLFPFAEWFWGPWDLFLEHGHRLLGATVGMLTLLLAAIVYSGRSSPILRWLVAAAVVLVIVQGALGGLRVILDDKTVAKVHACTGPLFFAVATAIAAIASRRGGAGVVAPGTSAGEPSRSPLVPSWAEGAAVPTALLIAAYLQLVAGAQLRHADATLAPATFRWMVVLHLVGAGVVTVLAALGMAAVGCETTPLVPPSDAASPTGGVAMELWFARPESRRYEWFVVGADGSLGYGGGMKAFDRQVEWRGALTPEEASGLRSIIDAAGWMTSKDPSRSDGSTPLAEIVLRAGGKERAFDVAGPSAPVDRAVELLSKAAARRFDAFMQRLPDAGPQPR